MIVPEVFRHEGGVGTATRTDAYLEVIHVIITQPYLSSPGAFLLCALKIVQNFLVADNIRVFRFSEIIPQSVCTRYGLYIGAKMAGPVRILIYIFVSLLH